VTIVEEDPAEANFAALAGRIWDDLKKMKDQDGRALQVETLPMPTPVLF